MTKLKAFARYFVAVTVIMVATGYVLIDFMARSNAVGGGYSVSDYVMEKRVEVSALIGVEPEEERVAAVPSDELEIFDTPEGSSEGPFASFIRSAGSTFEKAPVSAETEETGQAEPVEWKCEMVKTIKRCKVVTSD